MPTRRFLGILNEARPYRARRPVVGRRRPCHGAALLNEEEGDLRDKSILSRNRPVSAERRTLERNRGEQGFEKTAPTRCAPPLTQVSAHALSSFRIRRAPFPSNAAARSRPARTKQSARFRSSPSLTAGSVAGTPSPTLHAQPAELANRLAFPTGRHNSETVLSETTPGRLPRRACPFEEGRRKPCSFQLPSKWMTSMVLSGASPSKARAKGERDRANLRTTLLKSAKCARRHPEPQ